MNSLVKNTWKWGVPLLVILMLVVACFVDFGSEPAAKTKKNDYAYVETPSITSHDLHTWSGNGDEKNRGGVPSMSTPEYWVGGQTQTAAITGIQTPQQQVTASAAADTGGPAALNSSANGIEISNPSTVMVFTQRGRAHGVGLCMDGVRYRAEAGQSCAEILGYYYTGVQISQTDDARPIRVKGRDGQVRTLSLRDYLYHLAEEPEDYPTEGLKVLYIAARTYTLNVIARGKHTAQGFDICPSGECCQAFDENKDVSKSPNNVKAVDATAGQIVTFNGQPITAAYCGSCGGHTENSEDVFGGAAVPYLRGKPDSYCSRSPRFQNTVEITAGALGSKLGVGSIKVLDLSDRTPGGRVRNAKVTGTSGSKTVKGITLQGALGFKNNLFDYTVK